MPSFEQSTGLVGIHGLNDPVSSVFGEDVGCEHPNECLVLHNEDDTRPIIGGAHRCALFLLTRSQECWGARGWVADSPKPAGEKASDLPERYSFSFLCKPWRKVARNVIQLGR